MSRASRKLLTLLLARNLIRFTSSADNELEISRSLACSEKPNKNNYSSRVALQNECVTVQLRGKQTKMFAYNASDKCAHMRLSITACTKMHPFSKLISMYELDDTVFLLLVFHCCFEWPDR